MFDALTGFPQIKETIFRKPHTVKQASPGIAEFSDKNAAIEWVYAVNYERATTKSFPTNVNGVDPDDLGIWGETTMY